MTDDEYMEDPRAKTVAGFIAGLAILSKYMEKGIEQSFFCGGEHDIIHFYVDADKLPNDSDDGRALSRLGFHTEDDSWAYFT